MKIKTFDITGMFGKENNIKLKFNSDINIITGRNGSGKTSALKLLWYILSGNILLALKEVPFRKAHLVTTDYECSIIKLSHNTCRIEWNKDGNLSVFEDKIVDDEDFIINNAEDQANELLIKIGSSVFLPTFRRIEGGFTIGDQSGFLSRAKVDIENSLISLSGKLSNGNHKFVASLSTVDIVNLLIGQYTDLSEQYSKLQKNISQEIIEKIRTFKLDETDSKQIAVANQVLDDIRVQIQNMEENRERIMTPLSTVRNLAMKMFRHSGIKIGKKLSFGDAANAINSDALSAGEKQMFSFIAYNAFYKDSIIIIDEPELSLHVDWQRQLFPILMRQQASNQFVIATHSPFIYSKYPEKEIQLDPDRGELES